MTGSKPFLFVTYFLEDFDAVRLVVEELGLISFHMKTLALLVIHVLTTLAQRVGVLPENL